MQGLLHPTFATTGEFPWLNLLWILVGITVLLFAVAGVGRWLASTHPDPVARTRPAPAVPAVAPGATEITPQVQAAIAAAVHVALGSSARITSVVLQQPPSVENLMLTWSLEGRRQIYTSHKVR